MSFSYSVDVQNNVSVYDDVFVLLNITMGELHLSCFATKVDVRKWQDFYIEKSIRVPIDDNREVFLCFTIDDEDQLRIEITQKDKLYMYIQRDLPQKFYAMIDEVTTEMVKIDNSSFQYIVTRT